MTVADAELVVAYEGPGSDDSLVGASQANFLVTRAGRARTESAVFVNRPAASYVLAELGWEESPESRAAVAKLVGQVLLPRRAARVGRVEPLLMVSRATFDEDPALIEAVRSAAHAGL